MGPASRSEGSNKKVDVVFTVNNGTSGETVDTDTATAAYQRLHMSELSAYMGATVSYMLSKSIHPLTLMCHLLAGKTSMIII